MTEKPNVVATENQMILRPVRTPVSALAAVNLSGMEFILREDGKVWRETQGVVSFMRPDEHTWRALNGIKSDEDSPEVVFRGFDESYLPPLPQLGTLYDWCFLPYSTKSKEAHHETIILLGKRYSDGALCAFVPEQEVSGAKVDVRGEDTEEFAQIAHIYGDIHMHPWGGAPTASGTDIKDMCEKPGLRGIISADGIVTWYASTKGFYIECARQTVSTSREEIPIYVSGGRDRTKIGEVMKEPRWKQNMGFQGRQVERGAIIYDRRYDHRGQDMYQEGYRWADDPDREFFIDNTKDSIEMLEVAPEPDFPHPDTRKFSEIMEAHGEAEKDFNYIRVSDLLWRGGVELMAHCGLVAEWCCDNKWRILVMDSERYSELEKDRTVDTEMYWLGYLEELLHRKSFMGAIREMNDVIRDEFGDCPSPAVYERSRKGKGESKPREGVIRAKKK
jgi:hypothetical protein